MWITLLIMAVAVSLEPIRIGLSVVMLNRPRPMLQLFVFLCGGFVMGLGGGLTVLFILRAIPLPESNFTVHDVQIVIGIFALLVATVLATNIGPPRFRRRDTRDGADPAPDNPGPAGTLDRMSARARLLMGNSSPWIAGVTGLGIALPSVDYLAALAVIHASGSAPPVQAAALVMFNAVAFALVEIPLVSFLVAPDRTRTAMARLNTWVRSRSRRETAALLAAAGVFFLALGLGGRL